MENWKQIAGFEGYYDISDLGRVRNVRTGAMKVITVCDGRAHVQLWRDNKQKCAKVHRLVLFAFRGPCPDGMEGRHNDGNSANNVLNNLRWDTCVNNHADKIIHGTTNRGERSGSRKLTLDQVRAIRLDPRMQKHIAADYGVRQSAISRIKTGVRWQYDH